MNTTFGSRKWVKLWVNEWLDGTTRAEMSDAQRAFWIDLLAMAGRSRYPGIICAGQITGEFVGYPLNKFQQLMSEPIDVEATFDLFVKNEKILKEITREEPTKLYKITICKWEQYQSEYQRQKPYREQKLQKSYSESYNQGYTTEVEVEVRSRSKKKEKDKPIVQRADDFKIFWRAYPRKDAKAKAEIAFNRITKYSLDAILDGLEKWKRHPQWENTKYIPLPTTFIHGRRWEDAVIQEIDLDENDPIIKETGERQSILVARMEKEIAENDKIYQSKLPSTDPKLREVI